jgi:hypothetical protein
MTTRLELRTALRVRLEDTGGTPLWDDSALNDFLAEAMRRYGTRFPREQSTTVVVGAGATSVVVTPELATEQIVRVFDGEGLQVPRQHDIESSDAVVASLVTAQAWHWWGISFVLAQGANAGTWTIEYLSGRALPADDLTSVEVVPGDEDIVVLLAAATALRRRAVEDGKRGLGHGKTLPTAESAETLQDQAEHLMRMRRRRARGGWTATA